MRKIAFVVSVFLLFAMKYANATPIGWSVAARGGSASGITSNATATAKALPNDAASTLTGLTVTYTAPDFFYVEEDNRTMGIRVEKSDHGLEVGMRADIIGVMQTNTHRERYILASSATQSATPNNTGNIDPLGMNNLSLGGGDWQVSGTAGQKGVTEGVGVNNIGLLVKVWGKFSKINNTTFQIDDGSGLNIRCTVPTGTVIDPNWEYVTVVGISSIYRYNVLVYLPSILVSSIQSINITPPVLVSAEAKEDGSAIDLKWTAPTYGTPTRYIVERSDGNEDNFVAIDNNVTGLTYLDTSGDCDITYYYRVIAVHDGSVNSTPSNVLSAMKCVSVFSMEATNPDPQDGARVVHTDLDNQIAVGSLSWTPDEEAESQDVYFGTDFNAVSNADKNSLEYKTTVNATVNSFASGHLAPNTEYYWRVDSTNVAGTAKGDVWTFKTGVSVRLVSVSSPDFGHIEYPVGREWNEVSWHEAGDILDFTVSESADIVWEGWSMNATGAPIFDTNRTLSAATGNGFVVPNNHATLYAVFQTSGYTLTLVGDPDAGQISMTHKNLTRPAAILYEEGDVAEITVAVNIADKWLFAGWESDNGGVFNDQFATTATYKMTAENTTVTAYAAKAVTNNVATGTRSMSAKDATGTGEDWWTTQINVAAYSPNNDQLYCRPMIKWADWAGFQSFPDQSLLHGLGKITLTHTGASSYSPNPANNINVSLYEVLKPWVYSTVPEGVWWLTTDGTTPWDTPGGDRGEQIGPTLEWAGVPTPDALKVYTLEPGKDYRYLLRNGIQVKSDKEGNIAYRKGMTKDTTVTLYYNPPEGPGNVIRDWAYLGAFPQGSTDDHQLRIDTDQVNNTYNGVPVVETQLAAKAGKVYGTRSWAVTSLNDDILNINALYGAPQDSSASYFSVYVNNPGDAIWPAYVGLGSADYSKVWTNGVYRGERKSTSDTYADQDFIGPFNILSGWNRILIKVENGDGSNGLYARLAHADRTAITGLTFSTSDDVAPSNPISITEAGGVQNRIAQAEVTAPMFSFDGATDDKSGVRGYKVYFGTDANGVPNIWNVVGSKFEPGEQEPGTYYLRVATVDYALNEAAPDTLFTFIINQ